MLFGCSTLSTIPVPDEEWTYCQVKEEADADYILRIKIDHKKYGHKYQELYFKVKSLDGYLWKMTSHPKTILADGENSSSYSSISIYEVSESGIVVSISEYLISDEVNYDFDHEFYVTYKQRGNISFGDIEYSWEWIKNPNQSIEPIVKTSAD